MSLSVAFPKATPAVITTHHSVDTSKPALLELPHLRPGGLLHDKVAMRMSSEYKKRKNQRTREKQRRNPNSSYNIKKRAQRSVYLAKKEQQRLQEENASSGTAHTSSEGVGLMGDLDFRIQEHFNTAVTLAGLISHTTSNGPTNNCNNNGPVDPLIPCPASVEAGVAMLHAYLTMLTDSLRARGKLNLHYGGIVSADIIQRATEHTHIPLGTLHAYWGVRTSNTATVLLVNLSENTIRIIRPNVDGVPRQQLLDVMAWIDRSTGKSKTNRRIICIEDFSVPAEFWALYEMETARSLICDVPSRFFEGEGLYGVIVEQITKELFTGKIPCE